MPKIFTTLDKIRPVYDVSYKVVMFLCKMLLIADILIASYAVLPFYLCMVITLLLVSFWPDVSLSIPKMFGGYIPQLG